MIFHDREEELGALETAFDSPNHELYVVYGRRRIGKTELVKKFCADRPHIGHTPSFAPGHSIDWYGSFYNEIS